jgi:hypothetical protein
MTCVQRLVPLTFNTVRTHDLLLSWNSASAADPRSGVSCM